MGIFDELFGTLSRREKLIADAEHVGDLEDVVRMGILCAQLGLVPEDIENMAKVYSMLKINPPESNVWMERIMLAARLAQRGD